MPVMNFLNTCIFDHGALARLPKVLAGYGVSKPFIITDPGIKAAGILDQVTDALGTVPGGVFSDTVANPTENQAIEVTELYKQAGADSIIALGGGSSGLTWWTVGKVRRHGRRLQAYRQAAAAGRDPDHGRYRV